MARWRCSKRSSRTLEFQRCWNITGVAKEQHCHDDIIERTPITYDGSVNLSSCCSFATLLIFPPLTFFGTRKDNSRTLGKAVLFVQSSFLRVGARSTFWPVFLKSSFADTNICGSVDPWKVFSAAQTVRAQLPFDHILIFIIILSIFLCLIIIIQLSKFPSWWNLP